MFWTLFIGLGAVWGAGMLWFIPGGAGMEALLPDMQRLPLVGVFFTSLFWPGLFLLVMNGITQLVAAGLIWWRHRLAPWAVLVCGLILTGWIVLQFVIFPLNALSSAYLVFGVAETVMAILWLRQRRQTGTT